MLLERQRDVQVIDALAMRDFGHLRQRAEQRQAAIADVIAAGAIVDEADDLIPELAVLQHAIGDHAARGRPRRQSECASARCRLASGARAARGRTRAART